MTRFPKLAGLTEIAGLAGVSRQRAAQLAGHPDFPKPVDRLAMGPVWREADVTKFLDTPRKPGRKPKEKLMITKTWPCEGSGGCGATYSAELTAETPADWTGDD